MDAEVKNEEVTDNGQFPIVVEAKQEIDESVELIEPKVELMDEMEVKIEEIDDSEYQHTVPYEYRDYLEQYTDKAEASSSRQRHDKNEKPTNSRKRKDDLLREGNSIKCQKCGISCSSHVRRHAIRHTNIKMYECPANQCTYKAYDSRIITTHVKRMHKSCTDPVRRKEMSDEEKQVLENMIQECFPKLEKTELHVICQLCHQNVKDSEQAKREHSNGHIDPILFKCDEQNCNFSTNFFDSFAIHALLKHHKACHKQEAEMQKWNDICFPNKGAEEVADNGQVPIQIEPKQEVVDKSSEMIESKVELIDEIDVKKEEIDDSKYQHIVPYEYRDYLEQHTEEQQSVNSRKRPAEDPSMHDGNSSECQKCGINVLSHVKQHAIRHTGLKMYECPASQCGFEDYECGNVTVHIKRKHKSCTDPVRKNKMSNEEKQVLHDMMHECFPKLDNIKLRIDVNCQLCYRSVKDCEEAKRAHSIGHIDPLLFNCEEQDCGFSTNWFSFFAQHAYCEHRKTFHPNVRKQQLIKQETKMRKWNDQCFSDKVVKEEDPDEFSEQYEYTCHICKLIITEGDHEARNRRIHASEHMDIMLCSVHSCQFETKYLVAMNNHQLTVHVSEPASSSGTSFRFLTAQEWGIERMLGRCFPELIKK